MVISDVPRFYLSIGRYPFLATGRKNKRARRRKKTQPMRTYLLDVNGNIMNIRIRFDEFLKSVSRKNARHEEGEWKVYTSEECFLLDKLFLFSHRSNQSPPPLIHCYFSVRKNKNKYLARERREGWKLNWNETMLRNLIVFIIRPRWSLSFSLVFLNSKKKKNLEFRKEKRVNQGKYTQQIYLRHVIM